MLITSILASCSKPQITQGIGVEATLFNESGVIVKFIPYYQGYPVSDYIFTIEHNDSFFLGNYHSKSEGKIPGFSTPYMSGMDSFHIVFDNSYLIGHVKYDSLTGVHYSVDPLFSSVKSISDSSQRNILEYTNYDHYQLDVPKHKRETIYKYTFTEADYEFAKE